MVNLSGSKKLLKNSQPLGPTYEDVMEDIDLDVDIRCITSHSGVRRVKPGSFEPFEYIKDMVLNRSTVVLKNDYWVLD